MGVNGLEHPINSLILPMVEPSGFAIARGQSWNFNSAMHSGQIALSAGALQSPEEAEVSRLCSG